MNKFKVGDKVYYPSKTTEVLTIRRNSYSYSCSSYPILALVDSEIPAYIFTTDGKADVEDVLPTIFHATPENKAKFEDFYGVEFEAPPVKPTSKDIIKAKLNKSTQPVPCWVSDGTEQPTHEDRWVFISQYDDEPYLESPYTDAAGYVWMYATPFDPETVEPITELPVGEYYE